MTSAARAARWLLALLALAGLAAGPCACRAKTAVTTRPNIIVILTDDHGYADVGVQGVVDDLRTPHLDRLAAEGVRATAGYAAAPQCVPSRAGLLTGRYPQRFGVDRNGRGPLPLAEKTLAERLQAAGYVTGMVGKWHLEPNREDADWLRAHVPDFESTRAGRKVGVPREKSAPYLPGARGFDDFFHGYTGDALANFDLAGRSLAPEGEQVRTGLYRLDAQSEAAVAFIRRRHQQPFFLYLAYFAPHTPLEAPEAYRSRFPGPMPERRRLALAMLSAIDDGIGRILDTLAALGLDENTLIVFTSDNGAPLRLTRPDEPLPNGADGGWDGSLNDPWLGEKSMLAEGGIRVPFLLWWKSRLPAGKVYAQPVSALDIAATALAAAGVDASHAGGFGPEAAETTALDGVDLVRFLTGQREGAPHDALYWRFWGQAAVRGGPWKYLELSDGSAFLFDLASDAQERHNVLAAHADVAVRLRGELVKWTASLSPPGLPTEALSAQETKRFEAHFGTTQ